MSSFLIKLRNLLLKPDSRLETMLRTAYHRLSATRLGFAWQHCRSVRSYRQFRARQNRSHINPQNGQNPPKITILLSTMDADADALRTTLETIRDLQSDQWDSLLVVQDQNQPSLPDFAREDHRFRLCANFTGNLLDDITGDYVIFCKPGDRFLRNLLTTFYTSLRDHPPADLTYYDAEVLPQGENHPLAFCKPVAVSPSLLLSLNYLSRGFINRQALRRQGFQLDAQQNLLSQEYDFVLRLSEAKASFNHIPEVLVSQQAWVTPDDAVNRQVVLDHLARIGRKGAACQPTSIGSRFTWQTNDLSVAIIIPTRNNCTLLEPLVNDILTHTDTHEVTITLVDNGSTDTATLAYYQQITRLPKVKQVAYNRPFNYSEAINLGVASSTSDLVLLLNDDMRVKDPDWLSELVQWASQPDIGVVGTKLLRANHTIQHAGIILGLNDFMGHIYLNAPEHYTGLFGSVDWYRDYAALTGACQMIRREVFERVGGYDTSFRLAFGDIDFCLRVQALGLRNVYTPFASLFHFEGQSRGYTTPVDDILRGFEKLDTALREGDPHYSPHLTRTVIPAYRSAPVSNEERINQLNARRSFYSQKHE